MVLIFLYWIWGSLVYKKGARISYLPNNYIYGWLNFSEYWSFHQGLPKSEKALIKRCLKDSPHDKVVAVDVGANIGLFTLTFAGLGYSEIHAFEPINETFTRLQKNIASNTFAGKIVPICLGLGEKEGFVEFEVSSSSPATNSISRADGQSLNNFEKRCISIASLDQYCDQNKIDCINFLKIDVEGMEILVLKGAQQLLQNKRVLNLLLEVCPYNLQKSGFTVKELYDLFNKFDYIPHFILEDGSLGDIPTLNELQLTTLTNLLLIPAQ